LASINLVLEARIYYYIASSQLSNTKKTKAAIPIIKIGFLKALRCRAFKKPIWVFPVPKVLETPKSVS
jgi:hypothetical protein